jgi:inorganic pyrophosphatase
MDSRLMCVIEIPNGSRNKYEYDPALGAIKLDRFISASVVYPTDYGYVPETLAPDGDPLDVLVCVSEPTFPGCAVLTNPMGLFKMSDEKGPDDHVVCVPCDDPGWSGVRDVNDLPAQLRAEISHFFSVYKDLDPSRHSEVNGWGDREAAVATVTEARQRFGAPGAAVGPVSGR